MKYAFFDLDGTLIPVDSSILWAETLLSHVGKDEKQLRAERIQYDVDYKNGCLDINNCLLYTSDAANSMNSEFSI